uniref:Lipoprotein n=1 Tax=viral metagenome TaxID=1070528 RepID=A0A6H1ZCA1_9ZZZZ
MKRLVTIFLLIALAMPTLANPKDWFDGQADKIGHSLAGATVAGLSWKHKATVEGALFNTLLVGYAKEEFDQRFGGKWDGWDLLATVIGGALFLAL